MPDTFEFYGEIKPIKKQKNLIQLRRPSINLGGAM